MGFTAGHAVVVGLSLVIIVQFIFLYSINVAAHLTVAPSQTQPSSSPRREEGGLRGQQDFVRRSNAAPPPSQLQAVGNDQPLPPPQTQPQPPNQQPAKPPLPPSTPSSPTTTTTTRQQPEFPGVAVAPPPVVQPPSTTTTAAAAAQPPPPVLSTSIDVGAGLVPWPGLTDELGGWPKRPPATCDGYFGNGFEFEFDLVPQSSPDSGYLKCMYNEAVKTSICDATRIAVDPARIQVSKGGEPLDSVSGRRDEAEMPVFGDGALVMDAPDQVGNRVFATKATRGKLHDTIQRMFQRVNNLGHAEYEEQCQHRVTEPTLFVTRYEYANLFHTSTDWYNAYMAARVLGLGRMPVVFLDGHCQSPMDQMWTKVFASVTYVKHLPGRTCFDRAVFVPLGYEAPLSMGITPTKRCPTNRYVREFSDVVLSSFGLVPQPPRTCSPENTKILFIRRLNYVAHPRHNGRIVSRIGNEADILAALQRWAASRGSGTTILEGTFSRMSMADQLKMMQDACVVVGAHGAGLSHVLFTRPGTQVLEIRPPSFKRPHFIGYSVWAGAGYVHWDVRSKRPDPAKVVSRVAELVDRPKPQGSF